MLDDIVVVTAAPTTKGQAIVPAWEDDYRTLLDDRYRYAEQLRIGQNGPFTETAVEQRAGHRAPRDVRRRQRDAELRPAPRLGPLTAVRDRASGPSGQRIGQRLITRAGTPAATQLSGMSPVTTLFAPITTWRPIVAPGSTTVP